MTDLRKAAEMALGALEEYTCVVQSGTDPNKWHEVVDGGAPARQAIEALRQALAQPEQEPVAWLIQYKDRHEFVWRKPDFLGGNVFGVEPLYTASPKREWVELTDDEGAEIWGDAHDIEWKRLVTPKEIVQRISDKLKEKNA